MLKSISAIIFKYCLIFAYPTLSKNSEHFFITKECLFNIFSISFKEWEDLFKEYIYDPDKIDAFYDKRKSEKNSIAFAILLDSAVIGEIGLRHINEDSRQCELSIHLQNDAVKNKGYGTKAELLAVQYAFENLNMEYVTADILIKNKRSQHVAEKIGFVLLGEEDGFKKYRLNRKDWNKKW